MLRRKKEQCNYINLNRNNSTFLLLEAVHQPLAFSKLFYLLNQKFTFSSLKDKLHVSQQLVENNKKVMICLRNYRKKI